MTRTAQSASIVPTLLGAAGVGLWASETTFITYTTAIPPLQTVALAFLFAALLTPLIWIITGTSPLVAFHQPLKVWLLMVGSLAGYHACIYYATQNAPPAAAALLQGTTPLMIVIGAAFLPGERLRWYHVVGSSGGLCGILILIGSTDASNSFTNSTFYLSLIGVAAALWGLYSVFTRKLDQVPSSALGVFYAAAAVVTFVAHTSVEQWVQPQPIEWWAIVGLGVLPMGLAIYLWDVGMKSGDIQALGVFSYIEPLIGTMLVTAVAGSFITQEMLWSGALIIGGAIVAGGKFWEPGNDDRTSRVV